MFWADIGSFLGVALETVSRLLGRLQRQGLISVAGRTLVLHDIPALEALVSNALPATESVSATSRASRYPAG